MLTTWHMNLRALWLLDGKMLRYTWIYCPWRNAWWVPTPYSKEWWGGYMWYVVKTNKLCVGLWGHNIIIEDNSTQAFSVDGPKSRVYMQGLKGSEGCNVDPHSVWMMIVIFIHWLSRRLSKKLVQGTIISCPVRGGGAVGGGGGGGLALVFPKRRCHYCRMVRFRNINVF